MRAGCSGGRPDRMGRHLDSGAPAGRPGPSSAANLRRLFRARRRHPGPAVRDRPTGCAGRAPRQRAPRRQVGEPAGEPRSVRTALGSRRPRLDVPANHAPRQDHVGGRPGGQHGVSQPKRPVHGPRRRAQPCHVRPSDRRGARRPFRRGPGTGPGDQPRRVVSPRNATEGLEALPGFPARHL